METTINSQLHITMTESMENNEKELVLILVAKFPKLNKSKTRLQPKFSPEFSVNFSKCCILDLCSKFSTVATKSRIRKVILFAPSVDEEKYKTWLHEEKIFDWELFGSDSTGSLGDLLQSAVNFVTKDGRSKVVGFIGMDQPHINAVQIAQSFEECSKDSEKAVLFPVEDGGYSFICCKIRSGVSIFKNVVWSTSETCYSQKRVLERNEYKVVEGKVGFDVDVQEDIEKLHELLKTKERNCSRVKKFLAESLTLD